MKGHKVYISGTITGTNDYMKRFSDKEDELWGLGYSVINPAKVNAFLPLSTTYEQYMEMSLLMLSMADTIYMLSGWEKSKGASLEHQYALTMGYQVLYEENVNG